MGPMVVMGFGEVVYRSFSSREACGRAGVRCCGRRFSLWGGLATATYPTDCVTEGGYWVVVVVMPDGQPASQPEVLLFNTE